MTSWVKFRVTGGDTIVSVADFPLFAQRRWHVSSNGYVVNRTAGVTLRLHRLVAGTPAGLDTDHINHNRTDNRRENLRVCDRSTNLRNASLPRWGNAALTAERTACARGHAYTPDTRIYKGERVCQECRNMGQRRRRAVRA